MLHTDWRISQGKDYRAIYKKGKRVAGRHIIIFAHPNDLAYNRFGIVASKKTGNAVIRNRAKRVIREVIRNNFFNLRPGFDVVIVARYNIRGVKFSLIEKDYLTLMRKACT